MTPEQKSNLLRQLTQWILIKLGLEGQQQSTKPCQVVGQVQILLGQHRIPTASEGDLLLSQQNLIIPKEMYTKLILTILIFMSSIEMKGQSIIYDLPEKVSQRAREYIEEYIDNNGPTVFIAKLGKTDDSQYVINLIVYDFESLENFSLLNEEIIKKTNRVVRVKNDLLLPLITDEDLQFAYLGEVPPRHSGGKRGKKRILLTDDSYSITFDKSGKIFKN